MPAAKMPFGKYRGRKLTKIPSDYLHWCLDQCSSLDDGLRKDIEKELAIRGEITLEDEPPIENLTGMAGDLSEKVRWIYRQMSMQHHPDRGGSPEAMKAINEFHLQVQNLIKRTFQPEE